jgi:hypothetical protein
VHRNNENAYLLRQSYESVYIFYISAAQYSITAMALQSGKVIALCAYIKQL